MARETGEVIEEDGDIVTIEWDGQTFVRDRSLDFVRDVPEAAE